MVTKREFGRTRAGQVVYAYTITNQSGSAVTVLNYGGIIQTLLARDQAGNLVDICLGYDTVAGYEADAFYLGALIGRHAGRIGGAAFTLNNTTYTLEQNEPPNHLHGGSDGFHTRLYDVVYDENGDWVRLGRLSPDGESGYPGNLEVEVSYILSHNNFLAIDYSASADANTVVNLTNHSYFNLNGQGSGDVLDHELTISATHYTEIDESSLPTGVIAAVAGTPFDFSSPKTIGRDIRQKHPQLESGNGYDHNFVLDGFGMRRAAKVFAPKTGIELTVMTTMPGMQLYTGNYLKEVRGKGAYGPNGGLCLETQFFPDGLAHSNFPSPVLAKGRRYWHTTVYALDCR
jgi:aldose 1-epimerase